MNNTNNALETLVQRDKQIKKANDKLKASINELDAELETTTNALSNHASNTEIHTSKEELIKFIVDHLESLDLGITKEVVSVLPTENISDNTLYFVPNDKGSHNEYLYINDMWELVGSTETNFTDYYTKLETNTLLEGKANSVHNHVVSDITDFPTIPTKLSQLENDMGFGSGSGGVITSVSWTNITDKPNFATVATSGSYNDLSNKPTIPNVYNKTLTIQKNGTNVATFTSNSNTDVTANITVPTKVSELSNDSGFITGISWDKVTNKPTLAKVATSGSYTDLSNTPTIPTKVSQLENDTGFINALTDVVDTKSNQTIGGNKSFSKTIFRKADITTSTVGEVYRFSDTNATPCGAIYNRMHWYNNNVYNRHQSYNATSDKDMYLEILSHNDGSGVVNTGGSVTNNKNLTTTTSGTDVSYVATMGWVNNPATSTNVVHRSGDETIDGIKTFTNILKIAQGTLQVGSDAGYSVTYSWSGDITSKQPSGTYNIALPKANGTLAIDENVVHTSGNETINGLKTFNSSLTFCANVNKKNNDVDRSVKPTSDISSNFVFLDKNNSVLGYLNHTHKTDGVNHIGVYVKDSNNGDHGFRVTVNNVVLPLSNNTYSLGSSSYKWANVYANRINCDNIVKTNETSYIYMTAGPAWNNGASIFLNGKSGDGLGTGKGTFLLFARDGTNERRLLGYPNGILSWNGCIESHEFRSTNGNAFMVQNGGYTFLIRNDGSNTYLLMSDKDGTPGTWSSARPLIINNATGTCNINGNANSATYATTQATTDNSTKIATTAWVRTYVNSVVGSGAVGASISAYYSNATTVTATGDATGTTTGVYPADYSDYINIAPTVGTIYTGSQLFSSFTPTASGTIDIIYPGPGVTIYQTTASAKATFSGAFTSSAKYLCTTANAVKFRAYTAQGSTSAVGSSSVVDNSSAKSIFIRVQ